MFNSKVIIICLISVCFGAEDQIQESSVQHPLSYISLEADSYEKDKPVEETLKKIHDEGQLQLNNTANVRKDDPKKKEIERKAFQLNYNEDINTGQNKNDKDQLVSLLIYHDDKNKNSQKRNEVPHVLANENKISHEINYKDFLTKYTDDTDFNDAYLKYLLQKQKIQKEANIQVQIYHEQKVNDKKHHHKDQDDKNKHDDYHHHEKPEEDRKHEHYKIHHNEHTHPDYKKKLKYELKHYPKLNDNRDAGKYRIYYGNAINVFDHPHKHKEESQTEGVEYLQHLKENADKAVHYITKHYYDHLQKHQNKRYGGIEVEVNLPNRHYPDYYENGDVVNKQYVDYQIRHETNKPNSQEHPNKEQNNVNTANPLKLSVDDANLSDPSEIKNPDQYNSLSEDNEFQDVYDMDDDDNFGYGQYGIDLKKVLEEATLNDQKLEHDFNKDTNEVFDVNDTEETSFKENNIGGGDGEEKDLIAEEFGLSQEAKIDPEGFLVNGHANVQNLANATTNGDVRSKRKSAEATSREIKRNSFKKVDEDVTESSRKYRGRKRTFPKDSDKLEVLNLNNTKGDSGVRNRKYGKKFNSDEIFRVNNEKKEIDNIFTTQPTRTRQRGQMRGLSTRFQDSPDPTINSVIPKQEDRYSRVNTRRPPNTQQQRSNNNKDSRESSETKEERKPQLKRPTNQRGRIRYTHVLTGIPTATTTTSTTTNRPIKPSRPIKTVETPSGSNVLVEHYFEAQTYRPVEGIINPYSGFTIPQYEKVETTEINFLKEPDNRTPNQI